MAEVATVYKSYGSFDAIVEPNRSIVYPEYLLRWVPYIGSQEVILRIALEQLFFLKSTDTSLDRFHIGHCVSARYIDIERWTGMDSRTLIRHLEHPTALIRKSKPKVGLVKGKAQQLPNTYRLDPLMLTPGDASDIYFFVKDLKEKGVELQDALDLISSGGLEKIVSEKPYRLPHQDDLFTASSSTSLFAIISTLYGEVSEEESRIDEIEAELLGIVLSYQAVPWYIFEEVLPVVGPHNLMAYLMCLPRTYVGRHNFRLKDGPNTISSWVGKKTLARGIPRMRHSAKNTSQVLTESSQPTSKEIDKHVLSILFSRVETVSGVGNYKIHLQSAPILPWHKAAMNVAKSLSKVSKETLLSIKSSECLNDYNTLLSLLSILKDIIGKLSPMDKQLFQQFITSKNIIPSDGLLPGFSPVQDNSVPFVTLINDLIDNPNNPRSENDPGNNVLFVTLDNENCRYSDNQNSLNNRGIVVSFVTLDNKKIESLGQNTIDNATENIVSFVTLENEKGELICVLQVVGKSEKNAPIVTLEYQIRVLFVILEKLKVSPFVVLGPAKNVLFVTLLKILKSLKILNLIKDSPPQDSKNPDLFSDNDLTSEQEAESDIENKKLLDILISYVDQKVSEDRKPDLALWLLEGIWRTSIKSPEGFAWKKVKGKVPPPQRFIKLLNLSLIDVKNGLSGFGIAFNLFYDWTSEQRSRLQAYLPAKNKVTDNWGGWTIQNEDDQLAENHKAEYEEDLETLDEFISEIESNGIASRKDVNNLSAPRLSRSVEDPVLWRVDFNNDYGYSNFEEFGGIELLKGFLGDTCKNLDICVGGVAIND